MIGGQSGFGDAFAQFAFGFDVAGTEHFGEATERVFGKVEHLAHFRALPSDRGR